MGRSESLRDNARKAVALGYHPGNYPLGYMRGSYAGPVVPDPALAPAVRAAFRLRAAGRSLSEVAAVLGVLGVRGARGGALSRQSVRNMLANPFYAGRVRLGGREYPGAHEALVSEEEFQAALRQSMVG